MTDLTKPITRRTTLLLDHRRNARNQDRVAVTLFPNGDIGFRAYRSRKTVRLPLATVYFLAIRQADTEARATKKKRRAA